MFSFAGKYLYRLISILPSGSALAVLLLAASCASVRTGSPFAGAPPAAPGYTDYRDAIEALSSGAVPRVQAPESVPAGIDFYDDLTFSEPDGVTLTLDLYVPAESSAPPPLMLFIHGGGWHQGKKEHTAYYNNYFAQRGYATASAAYRLSPEHTFPAAIQDVKCAMVWLKQHGPEYGFDGNRVVLIGGSAGGHLSLLAGYSQDPALACPNAPAGSEPEVKGIVNFYGVVDCTTPRAQAAHQVNDFIGQPYSEAPERYAQASPIHHLDAHDPPTLTFHGTIDELVPISQADTLHARLDELNVPNYYDRVEGWHHSMDLAVPLSERFCYVTERFLKRYLPLGSAE